MKENDITKKPNELQTKGGEKPSISILPTEKLNILSFLIAVIAVTTILVIGYNECRTCFTQLSKTAKCNVAKYEIARKRFRVYGRNIESGYLHNVLTVLDRLGYTNDPDNSRDWDLLWAHDYPFRVMFEELKNLRPHQKVNHFPGCGYITNKVDLATSGLKYIPPAFKLPQDKHKLLEYAGKNANVRYVQKHNEHRHIRIKNVTDIDLSKDDTFVQEFVDKPLLVNGYKFDIGIYTIITSIDPLRIYIYNGEALLRFCPVKYYPFDPNDIDKYVVGDDYLPPWDVPDLSYSYKTLKLGMKQSVNRHLRSIGKDPEKIWLQIEESIRIVLLANEPKLVDSTSRFKSKDNFFEMMRFDFVVDEDLNVFLMEANMSPNLSSAHFPPNRHLFEQIIYNMLGLVGIGEKVYRDSLAIRTDEEESMLVADKNIAVFADTCSSELCQSNCISPDCHLCLNCLSGDTKSYLFKAYKEHVNKGDCKRIFPPQFEMGNADKLPADFEKYSPENQLQYMWFQGKCLMDSSWCF